MLGLETGFGDIGQTTVPTENLEKRNKLSLPLWGFVESFKHDILSMHPFIIPHDLDDMVHAFLDNLPMKAFVALSWHVAEIPQMACYANVRPAKRYRKKPTEIETAIIHMVFALGTICQAVSWRLIGPARIKADAPSLPGFEFFVKGLALMGLDFSGRSLANVQAQILACLYCGQLGRVKESFGHIVQAGHLMSRILKP